jgi:hypothetical protein
MLVPNANEVHGQQIFHHLYTIICHLYITIKLSNLNNDMWQLKKVWIIIIKNCSLFWMVFNLKILFDTLQMPHGIKFFLTKMNLN